MKLLDRLSPVLSLCILTMLVIGCRTQEEGGALTAAQPTVTAPRVAAPASPLPPTAAPPTAAATVAPLPATALPTVPSLAGGPTVTLAPVPTVAALTPPLQGQALIDALRRGGYVLYFRHAATDFSQTDDDAGDLANCQTQRNLNDKGRTDSRSVGDTVKALGIPIGQVGASAFCRTRETAELAFGQAPILPDLNGRGSTTSGEQYQRSLVALRRLLGTPPAANTNTVLVSHQFNLNDAVQVNLAEGEAAVFEPQAGGAFRLVARIPIDQWTLLAQAGGATAQGGPKAPPGTAVPIAQVQVQEYPVPRGSRPHDVAPAPDGSVWYTAQGSGELGRLDPKTGQTKHIPLGRGSAPHGVIVGPDGAAWVTDGGLNAIVRVDPATEAVQVFPLPSGRGGANLNTATFDGKGVHWFTGQSGVYGRLDPKEGQVQVFDAPRGRGPYGIATTPSGDVYYVSLAGSHMARIDLVTGAATIFEPPTQSQGARRVWSDSRGRLWVSEWDAGQLGMYDPATDKWREWKLPGSRPQAYAVYVDERDMVWVTDFGNNALVRFDPTREAFDVIRHTMPNANVRQLLGRPGEVWGAMSGQDRLVVVRTPQ